MIAFIFVICAIATTAILASPSSQNVALQQQNAAHYANEKEEREHKPEILAEDQDTLPLSNEYRRENLPYNAWNPFRQDSIPAPPPAATFPQFNRFPPLFSMLGIPSTLFIPFPLMLSPQDYFYPPYPGAEDMAAEEQMMSRANGRRPSPYRNSPIYYVRIPPTPYMFVPGLGYTSQPPIFTPMLPYSPLSTFAIQPPVQPPISSMINLPLNFLSNGKPSGVYQLDTNGLQAPYQPFSPPRPLHRPSQYVPQSLIPDSKITHLKRPFLFNGRPEDIYVLPQNFNSFQSIYQSPQQGYY